MINYNLKLFSQLKAESASAMLVNFEDDDCNDSVKESFSQQLQRVILDYLQDLSDTEPSLLVRSLDGSLQNLFSNTSIWLNASTILFKMELVNSVSAFQNCKIFLT